MIISCGFDGGAIEVVRIDEADRSAELKVRADAPHAGGPFMQFFHFRVQRLDTELTYRFTLSNASDCTFPDGFDVTRGQPYLPYFTYDRKEWLTCDDTRYEGGALTWRLRPAQSCVWFAYYPPYSQERLLDWQGSCQSSSFCRLDTLGTTPDGHSLDVLCIGDPPPRRLPNPVDAVLLPTTLTCWVVARQHPGETQASWWCEGFVARLLAPDDPCAKLLRARCEFYVVPNANPDGSCRGHLRSNAAGTNLNREWAQPSRSRSPEVFAIERYMYVTGVDFCVDAHSEEALPFAFCSKTMLGIPSLTDRQRALYTAYTEALARASPEVSLEEGYPRPPPGKANLGVCCAWVAEVFDALAVTQEMPFKDNAARGGALADRRSGWSIERCKKLGAACCEALLAVMDELRPPQQLSPEAVLLGLRRPR